MNLGQLTWESLRAVKRAQQSIVFLTRPRRVADTQPLVAHVLVSKRNEYVSQARVCIESYLIHSPADSVVIHFDTATAVGVKHLARYLRSFGRRNVTTQETDAPESTWQEQKYSIARSMIGSRDVLMDADLKWHGRRPARKGVTFLVAEYNFEQRSPARQLEAALRVQFRDPKLRVCMRNLSFFSWGGLTLNSNELDILDDLPRQFDQALQRADLGADDISFLWRMREQISLSIFVDLLGWQTSYVKATDALMDGGLVESSYYGVTGTRI